MYHRTTARLVEKNCREHQLFTHPAPATPPTPTATTTGRDEQAASAEGRDAA